MSDPGTTIDAQTHADLAQMTAEALIARGERLLKVGRELLSQAAHTAALAELPEERSVGRFGIVTEQEAIAAAKELGQFTRKQFAEKLGLSQSGVSRWLAKLIDREHPVISRGGGGYSYIEPVAGGRTPERRPAPETELIDRSQTPTRGQAVRVPARQRMKQDVNKSGRRGQILRKDEAYERQRAARDARERAGRNGKA